MRRPSDFYLDDTGKTFFTREDLYIYKDALKREVTIENYQEIYNLIIEHFDVNEKKLLKLFKEQIDKIIDEMEN